MITPRWNFVARRLRSHKADIITFVESLVTGPCISGWARCGWLFGWYCRRGDVACLTHGGSFEGPIHPSWVHSGGCSTGSVWHASLHRSASRWAATSIGTNATAANIRLASKTRDRKTEKEWSGQQRLVLKRIEKEECKGKNQGRRIMTWIWPMSEFNQ